MKRDPYKALCKTCGTQLVVGLSELKKHSDSKKHQDNTKATKTTKPITEMVTTDKTLEQVRRAEIKLAAFVVEHNLSFTVTDHLSDLVVKVFPDSAIARKYKSKHTKTRSIIKHVLADQFKDEL